MAKVTMVTLVTRDGAQRAFTVDHAERILTIRNSGWRLPDGSEYELQEDGTIIRRSKTKKH